MKRCSTSYVLRKLQIKIMKYNYIRIDNFLKRYTLAKIEQQELSFIASGNAKHNSHFGR